MTMTEQRTGTIAELHQRLVDEIHGKTGQSDRKLANNTYGSIAGDVVTIRLHATNIALVFPHLASYRTGGWYTVTTKERINRYLPGGWNLGSEKSVWYLSESLPNGEWDDDFGGPKYRWEKRSRFYDEILLRDSPEGTVVDEPRLDDPDAGMRHRISQYVKLYTDEQIDFLVKTAQSQGYKGDCWYCLMTDVSSGESFGDVSGSDHLEQHMIQRYTMVSLMINALTEKGYRDPGAILAYGMHDSIRRAIRTYMLKRLTQREGR